MHVLIATDGSPNSVNAATRAGQLLCAADRITLLSVVTEEPGDDAGGIEGSVYTAEEADRVWQQELTDASAEIEHTAAALGNAQVEKRIEVGDVDATIVRVADELQVDVIVVGSHGRTGLNRLFLGSVSEHVVRHAHCPVLVVREPAPK